MTPQFIDVQLELLRLKELFMSDIDIRSKMAMLICREENSSYCDFCELTHCTPDIAKISRLALASGLNVSVRASRGDVDLFGCRSSG